MYSNSKSSIENNNYKYNPKSNRHSRHNTIFQQNCSISTFFMPVTALFDQEQGRHSRHNTMYTDKFQIRRVRFPQQKQTKKSMTHKRPKVRVADMPYEYNYIRRKRLAQFRQFKRVAIAALQLGSTMALKLIYPEYEEYRILVENERNYRRRNPDVQFYPDVLLTPTPQDLYNKLPSDVQALWDTIPELKAWRES